MSAALSVFLPINISPGERVWCNSCSVNPPPFTISSRHESKLVRILSSRARKFQVPLFLAISNFYHMIFTKCYGNNLYQYLLYKSKYLSGVGEVSVSSKYVLGTLPSCLLLLHKQQRDFRHFSIAEGTSYYYFSCSITEYDGYATLSLLLFLQWDVVQQILGMPKGRTTQCKGLSINETFHPS